MSGPTRILIVGAGAIADTHAEAIRSLPGISLAGVVDPNPAALEQFVRRWAVPASFSTVAAALESADFGAAHVLTPPDRHAETAMPLIEAGIATLVEKPLAATMREASSLQAAAMRSGALLGVNQNFVFHPAFLRLRAKVTAGEVGPLRFLTCVYHAPLRQFAARQFGHWMFREPLNMLLEQAVHPLSQLRSLAGPFSSLDVRPGEIVEVGAGAALLKSLTAIIDARDAPISFRFAVGESFPVWRLEAVGTDGVIVADIFQNTCHSFRRTQWLDAIDAPVSSLQTASALFASSGANAVRYGLSQLRLGPRADGFYRSMRASIAAFHEARVTGAAPETNAAFGSQLVGFCTQLADAAATSATPTTQQAPLSEKGSWDVAVLGGAGFIGAYTVAALVKAGYSVSVMARNVRNLDPVFAQDKVVVMPGDARSRDDVARAIGAARYVVNLAHGGGGANYEEILASMQGSAEQIADVCLEKGVERLIHVSSIAALYLGRDAGVVFDAPPDPRAHARADYARAKAATDKRLLEIHARKSLPLVLLRPGLVVGAGTSPLHSGVGFYNNDQHCVGWGGGGDPLPFVLADDVASAIVASLAAPDVIGRSFNLVGDFRPTAREYIGALAQATRRPLRFHPAGPTRLWLSELLKWSIKRAGGRLAPFPSRRDFASRTLRATIDCSAAKAALGWNPETDGARFYAAAFASAADHTSAEAGGA